MFDIILKNGNLITMNNNDEILYNKDLFIKDGKIVAIKETSNKKNLDCINKYDVTNKYLLPGFINTHTHIFQTLLRGIGADLKVWDWFETALDENVSNLKKEHCFICIIKRFKVCK